MEKPVENSYIKKGLIKYTSVLCIPQLFSEMCRVVVVLARQLPSCQVIQKTQKFDKTQYPWYYWNWENSENSEISNILKLQKWKILSFSSFSEILKLKIFGNFWKLLSLILKLNLKFSTGFSTDIQ